ncbi:ABC transporter substrate-binding protein [Pedomonas mirosovicensis]|uniref:ABC transporter substrate-binding protein n=1 Tax=Pedomonas mirosovicensis TaxID=2908641 RepID=UPI00216A22D9|nr:ABC transporter substrate-binding protein [Pedomonas mirosovicensis]MCH8684626.1 ABC transporter substrate-binding protein [Pedomonas mirosovicensis]
MKQLFLSFLFAALAFTAQAAEPHKAQPKKLRAITFYTDWKAQAEHGGFYQAVALGLYEKHGLKVTIRAGGPQSDNTRLLAAGAIETGMLSNSFQALNLAAKGANVKVVMAPFQKDPQVLMVHPGTGVKSLADLKGRPIYVADAALGSYWPWLKRKFGFTDAQMRKYAYSLLPWLRNSRAAQEGYLSSEPLTAAKAGVKPQVFLLADAGWTGYAAMVAFRGEVIAKEPEVVRAFVEATREGWESYLTGDPTPGNRLILKDNPEMTPELLAYARGKMIEYGVVISGDAKRQGIGAMTPARWAAFHKDMSSLKLIPAGLDPKKAYTLEFLK